MPDKIFYDLVSIISKLFDLLSSFFKAWKGFSIKIKILVIIVIVLGLFVCFNIVIVPNVEYYSLSDAQKALADKRLKSQVPQPNYPHQVVIETNPKRGSLVFKESTIALALATSTPVPIELQSPEITISPTPIQSSPVPISLSNTNPITTQAAIIPSISQSIPAISPAIPQSSSSITYNNDFYAFPVQLLLRGYQPLYSTYDYVQFGHYKQSRKNDPILWRVLAVDDCDALLLSEYVLDVMPFSQNTNSWIHSDIKHWLNNTFLDTAFSDNEKTVLLPDNGWGQVFLLSETDLLDPVYGFTSDPDNNDPHRIAPATKHAINNGVYTVGSIDKMASYYLSSEHEKEINLVDMVYTSGKIGIADIGRHNVGIRPAMWIALERLRITNGEGTKDDPYILNID